MRRQSINHFATGHASGHGFAVIERREMFLPIIRQAAVDRLLPTLAEIGIFCLIVLDQLLPARFLALTARNGFAKVVQGFVGNVKLLVLWPAKLALGFADCFVTRWVAVSFARAGGGHSEADLSRH